MVEIDYNESVIKRIGNFGYEIIEIVGACNKENFKITLSSSPINQNNNAECIEGDLTDKQINEVLMKFNMNECRVEDTPQLLTS